MKNHILVWFRNDLRTEDNPALDAALVLDGTVTALYIHETTNALRQPGGAALWWLENSLASLKNKLASKNIALVIETGNPALIIDQLISAKQVNAVFWNRRYAPQERDYDATLKLQLKDKGIKTASFAGNLLVEPWEITTASGSAFQVYTPFAKALRNHGVAYSLPFFVESADITTQKQSIPALDKNQPKWAKKFAACWHIGETAALETLYEFFDDIIGSYPQDRDRPSINGTSKLSPYLRFGEISIRQIWHATLRFMDAYPNASAGAEKFMSELIWRDFHYYQLYHRADITHNDMRATLSPIEWSNDPESLQAWTKGQTGIPIVDAGMRQLWATGWMHNRVRMLVASFLTKNLMIDWRIGEEWFWDTLVDADVASNPASWQWVAGCGMDAAPYFRVFNPVVQGKRFDPDGDYVRHWVPELTSIPSKWVHCPAEAPVEILRRAGLKLGSDYPLPIADLSTSQRLFKQIMKG